MRFLNRWKDIRISASDALRNVLIHGYASVHPDKTWDIVTNELPILVSEVNSLLAL